MHLKSYFLHKLFYCSRLFHLFIYLWVFLNEELLCTATISIKANCVEHKFCDYCNSIIAVVLLKSSEIQRVKY